VLTDNSKHYKKSQNYNIKYFKNSQNCYKNILTLGRKSDGTFQKVLAKNWGHILPTYI
jgi:hypothetical protein